jgi:hypothetical protein
MTNMKFHSPTDNTSKYLFPNANNFPYGAPDPSLADDELPYGDEPSKACAEEDGVKCYCCGGYFPESSCVANTLDENVIVAVCETCSEGRVG